MSTYLLVHGFWHGAWCWHRVVPQLERAGHRVLVPDFGQGYWPCAPVRFTPFVNSIRRFVEASPEPVILVGHAFAGMIISQVAELCPENVSVLVYLAALLPQHGDTARDLLAIDPSSRAHLGGHVQGPYVSLCSHSVIQAYYHDCQAQDVHLAERCLRWVELLEPLTTPVTLTECVTSVPRCAILCLQDRVLSPELQVAMAMRAPCEKVGMLRCGHTPFFSAPRQLVDLLLRVHKADPWCTSEHLWHLATLGRTQSS